MPFQKYQAAPIVFRYVLGFEIKDLWGFWANSQSIVGLQRGYQLFLIPKGITGSSATILQYSMNLPKGPKDPSRSLLRSLLITLLNSPELCLKSLKSLFALANIQLAILTINYMYVIKKHFKFGVFVIEFDKKTNKIAIKN